jgi:hypothetical protein
MLSARIAENKKSHPRGWLNFKNSISKVQFSKLDFKNSISKNVWTAAALGCVCGMASACDHGAAWSATEV